MTDRGPDESEIARWAELGEPFSGDLMKAINNHRREVPPGAVFFSMAQILAYFMEVQTNSPEESREYQDSAHKLIDHGFKHARKLHESDTLSKMFPVVQ